MQGRNENFYAEWNRSIMQFYKAKNFLHSLHYVSSPAVLPFTFAQTGMKIILAFFPIFYFYFCLNDVVVVAKESSTLLFFSGNFNGYLDELWGYNGGVHLKLRWIPYILNALMVFSTKLVQTPAQFSEKRSQSFLYGINLLLLFIHIFFSWGWRVEKE